MSLDIFFELLEHVKDDNSNALPVNSWHMSLARSEFLCVIVASAS